MEQKRVSFKVAQAIKDAGYPQDLYGSHYSFNGVRRYGALEDNDIFAPAYLDVWLWLWREKKVAIPITCNKDEKWSPYGMFASVYEDYKDPEEAIEAAIKCLVANNLIK